MMIQRVFMPFLKRVLVSSALRKLHIDEAKFDQN